jgi:selenocysteine-specific elongation factor
MPQEVFRYCLERLTEERRISQQEDMVALFGREVQLSAAAIRIRESVEELLLQASWHPPSLQEIPTLVPADPAEVKRICFWMLKEKILVKISEDLVYHRTTIQQMKDTIRNRYTPGSAFGVAEFKELFDLTRKHAIPLLEFLDREHFTRRQASERILLP